MEEAIHARRRSGSDSPFLRLRFARRLHDGMMSAAATPLPAMSGGGGGPDADPPGRRDRGKVPSVPADAAAEAEEPPSTALNSGARGQGRRCTSAQRESPPAILAALDAASQRASRSQGPLLGTLRSSLLFSRVSVRPFVFVPTHSMPRSRLGSRARPAHAAHGE